MTPSQTNWLEMLKAVKRHCSGNQDLIEKIPPFVIGVNTLGQMITAIECLSGQYAMRPGEMTRDKTAIRLALCKITASNISAAKTYAIYIRNEALEQKLSKTFAELKAIPEEELFAIVQGLYEVVNPLAPKLAVYGLTSGVINAWHLTLTAFSPTLKSPKAAMIQRKNLTICFNQLFKDALRLCNDFLDPLAASLDKKNAGFSSAFLEFRKVKELSTGGTRIRGTVKMKNPSSFSEEPVCMSHASVTVVESGIVVKSDEEGNFFFRAVRKGCYTLRAEKEGFYTKTSSPFELKEGETAHVEFILLPSEILQD
jgi:hypothetical protein